MMYYKGTNFKRVDKETEFKLNDTNIGNLNRLGFRYKRSMSDAEDDVYEYSFPVYRYHMSISLECRFLLWQKSNRLKVDVFDYTTHGIYGPWYNDNSGVHEEIIKIINKNILKEMKRLNITVKNSR